jgi:hypothetical protein
LPSLYGIDVRPSSGNNLYLHVHKTPKKAEIAALYAHFAAAATQHGVAAFEVVPKRGNLTSENFEWAHERFSRKKVLAATLSSHAAPRALGASGFVVQ